MNHAIDALGALAQETRMLVFKHLVKAGPEGMPAGNIAAALDLPANTLSFHLNQMRQAGLVGQRRQGRSIIYAVDFVKVEDLLRYLLEDCCQGMVAVTPNLFDGLCCPLPETGEPGNG